MYLLQCPFYVKNYLRTHNRILLQGNPVIMQAKIDFLFSYFARFFLAGGGWAAGQQAARFFFFVHDSSDENIHKSIIMRQDLIYSEEFCP